MTSNDGSSSAIVDVIVTSTPETVIVCGALLDDVNFPVVHRRSAPSSSETASHSSDSSDVVVALKVLIALRPPPFSRAHLVIPRSRRCPKGQQREQIAGVWFTGEPLL